MNSRPRTRDANDRTMTAAPRLSRGSLRTHMQPQVTENKYECYDLNDALTIALTRLQRSSRRTP